MAVQLARLSLWLATLAADKPLTFLDHRLRVGHSLSARRYWMWSGSRFPAGRGGPEHLPLFPADEFATSLESAIGVRRQIAEGPDDTLEQVRGKERTLAALESENGPLGRWREAADLWCAAWLDEEVGRDRRTFAALLDHVLQRDSALPPRTLEPLLTHARAVSRAARVFNWAMEFPEVFYGDDGGEKDSSGFDVVLGNPPWDVLHETEGHESGRRLTVYAGDPASTGSKAPATPTCISSSSSVRLRLLKPGGRCALILPSGFATDQGSGRLRRHLLERTAVDTFTIIDNRDGMFPVHRVAEVVLLTFSNRGADGRLIPCRLGCRSAEALDRLPDSSASDRDAVTVPIATGRAGERRRIARCPTSGRKRTSTILGRIAVTRAGRCGPCRRLARPLRPRAQRDRRPAALHSGTAASANRRGQSTLLAFRRRCRPAASPDSAGSGRDLVGPAQDLRASRLAYRDVASATNRLTFIAAIVPRDMITTHTVFCLKELLDDECAIVSCAAC